MTPHDPELLAARREDARRRRRIARGRLAFAAAAVVVAIAGLVVLRGGKDASRSAVGDRPGRGLGGGAAWDSHGLHASKPHGDVMERLRAMGLPVYCGGHRGSYVALTFDDGPGPYTHLALRELRAAHARATFFLVGRNLVRHPDLPRQELGLGALGDHTYSHPYLPALPEATVTAELSRTRNELTRLTGSPTELFRPPYGARTPPIDREAQRLSMLEVLWDVDSADALGADKTRIAAIVAAGSRPGAIVLMHENRGQTIVALRRRILPMLRRRHLRAVTVPELLALDPPTPAQLQAGRRGCPGNVVHGGKRLTGPRATTRPKAFAAPGRHERARSGQRQRRTGDGMSARLRLAAHRQGTVKPGHRERDRVAQSGRRAVRRMFMRNLVI